MGLTFNISYDSSVNSAPAGFKAAVTAAEQAFQSLFSDPITINIQVGYGEVAGQSLGGGALGASLSYQMGYGYGQIRNALVADASSTTDQTALNNLPAADPSNGVQYLATTAEAKALGLMGPSSNIDGCVGVSSSLPFSYDPSQRAVAGTFDFIGVVEHEFSEVMGRISAVSTSIGNALSVLDLFRYSAPGARQFVGGQPSYFSVDGGQTNLNNFNTDPRGDYGDWAASAGSDAFLAFSSPGVTNGMGQADVALMDALGFDVAATPSIPVPTAPQAAMTVAGAIAAYNANHQMAAVTISDNAGNISAGFDALQVLASASKLTAITLTGPNVGLTIAAAQLQTDAAVLAAIKSSFTLTVTGVSAQSAATIATQPHVVSIVLSDSAANVSANLDGLQTLAAAGKLSSITLSDGGTPTLALTALQFNADASVLSKIGSAYNLAVSGVSAGVAAAIAAQPHVATIAVSDSAANVSANLNGLQALAANGKLSAIALTGTGTQTLSVTAAQFAADTAALHAISTPYALNMSGLSVAGASTALAIPQVATVSVSDNVANVSAGLDALQQLASQHKLTSISLTAAAATYGYYYYYAAPIPTLAVTAAQLSQDAAAIAAITSNYSLTVSGASAAAAAAIALAPHVTTMALSDSAANVSANLDGLQTLAAAGKLSSITLSDGGTPTLALTALQFNADASVLSKIGSAYNLAVSGVSAGVAAAIAAQPHVATIAVSDSAANVSANLNGLQALAANGKLSAIALTGTGTQTLSVTAAQFAADTAALHAISTPYALNMSGLSVAGASTALAIPQVATVSVSDNVANVSAGLDALQQLASQHKLTSISLTAAAATYGYYYYYAAPIPTLAVTAAQLSQDAAAIAAITSNYSLTVSGASAAAAAAIALAPHVTTMALSDSAANVSANLDGLQTLAAAGKLSSITLSDGGTPTLALTALQFNADASVLSKIGSAYNLAVSGVSAGVAAAIAAQPHVATIAVSDSAANVSANLNGLQALAANGKLSAIALTGTGTQTLSVTAAQFAADTAALHAISTPYALNMSGLSVAGASTALAIPQVATVSVSDNVANVSAGLDALQQLASQHKLTSISLTAAAATYGYYYYYAAPIPTLAVTAAQLSQDAAAIAAITSNYSLTVSGASAAAAAAIALAPHVTTMALSDSAANVSANLDGLQTLAAAGKLSSITLSDGGTPTLALTALQFNADASVLSKIGSAYNLAVSGVSAGVAAAIAALPHVTSISLSDSAANVSANLNGLQALVANGKLSAIALTDAGTPTLKLTALQQQADAGALHDIVTPFAVQTVSASQINTPAPAVANFINAVSSFAPMPSFSQNAYETFNPQMNGTGLFSAHPLA